MKTAALSLRRRSGCHAKYPRWFHNVKAGQQVLALHVVPVTRARCKTWRRDLYLKRVVRIGSVARRCIHRKRVVDIGVRDAASHHGVTGPDALTVG